MACKEQPQDFSDNPQKTSSHKTNGNGARVMVGENREHFSVLHGNRHHQLHYPHDQNYHKRTRVSSVIGGSETNSGDESENEDTSEAFSLGYQLSLIMKNRLSSCHRLMCSRRPRGIGVCLILVIVFLEAFAYSGVFSGTHHLLSHDKCQDCPDTQWKHFILSIAYSSAGRVFYPVAGIIADSYLGRYRVINIGLWLLWVGFALNALTFSFLWLIPSGVLVDDASKYIIAIVSIFLFSAGSGSVEGTTIPFGVDQLSPGVSSDEISSYFHYYYIARNVAGLAATVLQIVIFDRATFFPHSFKQPLSKVYITNDDSCHITQSVVSVTVVSAALLLLFHCRSLFYRDRPHSNALKSVTRVSCFAARVKRQFPQRNRAFRYGGARTPRIDLAKTENDGNFDGEEVEEVKTFYRMLLLISSLFGYFVTHGAGYSYMSSVLTETAMMIMSKRHSYLAENVVWIINMGVISLSLPLINHCLISVKPTLNIRLKIGMGFLLQVSSFGVAGLIQWRRGHMTNQQFFYLMFLPVVLLSLGEAVVFVSGLEFIYAQSPNNMKGLQTGLFYLIYGIFGAIGSTVHFIYVIRLQRNRHHNTPPEVKWSHFCVIILSIGSVGLVVYLVVAWCYKNRRRPATDEAAVQRLLIYANVYGSGSSRS